MMPVPTTREGRRGVLEYIFDVKRNSVSDNPDPTS